MVQTFTSTDEPHCVTVKKKATEQYFHLVLFVVLYNVALTFRLWTKLKYVTTWIKAYKQYVGHRKAGKLPLSQLSASLVKHLQIIELPFSIWKVTPAHSSKFSCLWESSCLPLLGCRTSNVHITQSLVPYCLYHTSWNVLPTVSSVHHMHSVLYFFHSVRTEVVSGHPST